MDNEHRSKPAAIRHAEKRRISTCAFADRIARISLDRYFQTVPETMRPNQTCLATIVAHYRQDDDLQVLAMGVGTKFLKESSLRKEVYENHDSSYGFLVRDTHAEVLARRAFRRQVTLELIRKLLHEDVNDKRSILCQSSSGKFTIRSDVTLHLYTSSAPCGNATLKKFAKMSKEKFHEDLKPDEWPMSEHEPIHGHSIRLGQFALLVKKDKTVTDEDITEMNQGDHPKGKSWPANESDDWAPPGTSIVRMNKGSIHTCSDKICRWNCIGLQGSFLASMLDCPLYLSSLTVGRKLTECICRRAVCCRIQNLPIPDTSYGYRINHPAIMGTAVYMDETGVVETNEDTLGQDVRFHSSLAWVWWYSMEEDKRQSPLSHDDGTTCHYDTGTQCFECIDGTTGLLAEAINEEDNGNYHPVTRIGVSRVSTYSLLEVFLRAYNLANNTNESIHTPLSLKDLICMKKKLSPDHEATKDKIFTKHRILRQWKRRSRILE